MHRRFDTALVAAILIFTVAGNATASPFDGLWVADLKTQMGQAGFDRYHVQNGIYKCESCRPPRNYPADGKMRPVAGDLSVLSEGTTIAGSRTMITRIVDHEMVRTTKMTVSPSGDMATYVSLDKWPGRSDQLRTEYVARRVAPAPAGAHSVSGSWRGLRYVAVPEEYRSVRLREANGRFTRVDYRRGRYTAKIGTGAALVTGDHKDIYKASVTAPDARTRVEVVSLNGKAIVERTYRISADGRSLITTVRDHADNSIYRSTSHRKQ